MPEHKNWLEKNILTEQNFLRYWIERIRTHYAV
uniref:Uncharacterized protein n=1 Tax=Arundo donax TaxID=35708 RepID=A0A0A9EBV3_ARUDO